jgi:hypothetical protein
MDNLRSVLWIMSLIRFVMTLFFGLQGINMDLSYRPAQIIFWFNVSQSLGGFILAILSFWRPKLQPYIPPYMLFCSLFMAIRQCNFEKLTLEEKYDT